MSIRKGLMKVILMMVLSSSAFAQDKSDKDAIMAEAEDVCKSAAIQTFGEEAVESTKAPKWSKKKKAARVTIQIVNEEGGKATFNCLVNNDSINFEQKN